MTWSDVTCDSKAENFLINCRENKVASVEHAGPTANQGYWLYDAINAPSHIFPRRNERQPHAMLRA